MPQLSSAIERLFRTSAPVERRDECLTWTDALRLFIRQVDEAGVLVMVSGVVMSNNHRRLYPAEFCGFALSDPLAPLVFVNGADTKAAQMFTLAHELAHIWLGTSALSNLEAAPRPGFRREEVWCNAVAEELLVPLATLRSGLQEDEPLPDALSRLAWTFKVSTLVILRRLLDANWLARDRFDTAWAQEIETSSPKITRRITKRFLMIFSGRRKKKIPVFTFVRNRCPLSLGICTGFVRSGERICSRRCVPW